MKLFEMFATKAHAQFGGGGTDSDFSLTDFNFLNPFGVGGDNTSVNDVFGQVVGIVLTVAAVVAFFYLIVSGFQYITAGGDAAKAQTARQGIVNALIGIVIILISYIILRFVATAVGN